MLARAQALVERSLAEGCAPVVVPFFDEATFTVSYLVHDAATRRAAIIDPLLDFELESGRVGTASADTLIDHVRAAGLRVDWILETHVHADHLSAAPYVQQRLGGGVAIGREVETVRRLFGGIFNAAVGTRPASRDFDRLLDDGDNLAIGELPGIALHVPGHTPADMAFVIGDAVFCGDTLFMPDFGTARADFPGGDARTLFRSIRRLQRLPDAARVFTCHDYKAPGRSAFAWESTMRAQRLANVHANLGVTEDAFVELRTARDRTLTLPRLLLPSVQVNMMGGKLPPAESNGWRYLRIPLDAM